MYYKPDIDKVLERCEAYWEGEIIDRCCVAILVGPSMQAPKELQVTYDEYYYDPEVLTKRWETLIEATYYGGDAMPGILPYFGTGGHSIYLDGTVQCRPDTIWIHPAIKNWDNPPLFNPENPNLKLHEDIINRLLEGAKGKYFISLTDNCGVMDALSNLRGPQELLIDLIDYPDEVKKMTWEISKVLKQTTLRHATLVRENNMGGSLHQWMHLWSKDLVHQLQCDFSIMVSPEMFNEFILPEIEFTCDWVDKSIYHLDGQEQVIFLDSILSVKKLKAIQWVSVAGQPEVSEFIPVLQRIQKAGKNLVLSPKAHEVETLMASLSSRGLQLLVQDVSSREEADELLHCVKKWTRA
jgi:hypothetical protein